jgi:predicted AlkP superfamily phosphohydrolase/phosphomutase
VSRVAAIVIDAAEWWYVERLLEEGRLPNLARLRARSAEAHLETPVAFRSELVWARFLHGTEPLEEREWPVCITFDPSTYTCGTNAASRKEPFFAFGDGTKTIALDLIHSSIWDPDVVEGVQVVGWGSHSPMWPRMSMPTGLLTEIDQRFGTNPAFGNDFDYGWHQPEFIDALVRCCEVGARRRIDIAEWLLTERLPDWDLFVTCVPELHSVGHQLWHGVDERHPLHGVAPTTEQAARAVERVCVAIDDQVGRLLEIVGEDTTVVVCAFHGFVPGDDVVSTALMPELFHRLHFGSPLLADPDQRRWRSAGCPPVVPDADEQIGVHYVDRFADSRKQRVRRAVRQTVPRQSFDLLRRLARRPEVVKLSEMAKPTPPETLEATPEAVAAFEKEPRYQVVNWYKRHWSSMRWFALPTFADGHVRVNLAGREANGLVAKEDYAAVLDEIETTLRACRDARTGEPIVDQVIRLREDDPFAADGPDADLLVVFAGAPDAIDHPTVGTIGPHPHMRTAHHSADGFALVAGPGIERTDLGSRPAVDVAATIVATLGASATVAGHSLVADAPART